MGQGPGASLQPAPRPQAALPLGHRYLKEVTDSSKGPETLTRDCGVCKGERHLKSIWEHFGVAAQITPHRWLAHCPSPSPIPPLGLLGGTSSDQGGDSAKGILGHRDWLLPPHKACLSWTSQLLPAA